MIKHPKTTRKRENSEQFDSEDDDNSTEEEAEEDAQIKKDAEEIERYIEQERKYLSRLLTEFPEDTKLTRKKARELDHDIIQLLHLGANPAEDVSVEIKDLQDMLDDSDDDDDEEYEPDPDEEYHSDDPLSTTCSDIDSQPRTPGDALVNSELDDSFIQSQPSVQYDEEGVFKRPPGPAEPRTPGNPDGEISKRTRSKFSLNTTDIETIEENFNPPDAVHYDTDLDPDESWQDFLKQFQRPLNALKADGDEEEEETDPEYVALASEAADVEEVEDTPITEDEVKALLNALLDFEEEEEDDEDCDGQQEAVPETMAPPAIIVEDPENPMRVQWSHIQPVAILHTKPELPRSYEMVLGADNKIYVLPRAYLRELVAVVPRRKKRPEGPIIDPQMTIDITGDLSELIEEVYDNKVEYREYAKREQVGVFTESSFRRLQIQLLKHIQLLGMHYTLAYSNAQLVKAVQPQMEMLNSLMDLRMTSLTINHLCWNLEDMYDLCVQWKKELDVDSEENREYVTFWLDMKGFDKRRMFPERLRELWLNSKAMMFSEFFPRASGSGPTAPLGEAEMRLFVMSCREMHRLRPQQTITRCIAEFIQHYAPFRTPGPWRRAGLMSEQNLIAEYFKTGQVPEVKPETMDIKSYDQVLKPAQRPKGTLPKPWDKYLFSKERIRRVYKNIVQPKAKKSPIKESPKPRPKQPLVASENKPLVTYDYKTFKVEFNIPEEGEETQSESHETNPQSWPVNLSTLGDPLRASARARARCRRRDRERRNRQRRYDIIRNLIHGVPRRNKCKLLAALRRRKCSLSNLYEGLWRLNEEFHEGLGPLDESLWSTKIFNCLKEFDIYARLLFARMKPIIAATSTTSNGRNSKGNGEESSSLGPAAKRPRLDDEVVAKRTLEMNKQYLRAQRMHANNRVLLQPEPTAITIERDSLFAWNYSTEVERALKASEFDEYLKILNKFNPRTESVPELYKRLEDLLLPNHSNFLELFISFLLPWHAAAVGQFFEHSMVTNMQTFIAKLRIYFDKQPNQWKKIRATLAGLAAEQRDEEADVAASQGVGVEAVKQRFLPLLKGNPLLIDWFNQLLPGEAPAEAQDDEFEELQTKTELPFEEIPGALITDVPDCPQTCAIKYMQGRIQYGNRVILPADLSFVATSYELNCDGGAAKESSARRTRREKKEAKRGGGGGGGGKKDKRRRKERRPKGPKGGSEKPVGCVHAISPAWNIKVDEGEEILNNSGSYKEASGGGGVSASRESGANEKRETNSGGGAVSVKEEFPLCDAATLRAHMNRLNPPIGENSSSYSTGGGGGSSGAVSDEATTPVKTSPKKNHEWKTVPMYSRTRSATAKPVSPKKAAGNNNPTGGGGGGNSNSSGAAGPSASSTVPPGSATTPKKKRQSMSNSCAMPLSPLPPRLKKEQLYAEEPEEIDLEDEEGKTPIVWTREEDKTILEAITDQKGDGTEEAILDQLVEALAGRERRDINTRFQFLISVVQQFQGA